MADRRRAAILPSVVRVATYTRISTDEDHQPFSLDAQTTRLGAYVQSQDGWEITRRYTDQMTGSTLNRPGLQRALADARVRSRDEIIPTFRIPATPVRVMDWVVGRGGLEPPTSAVAGSQRCSRKSGRANVVAGVIV